MINILSFLFFTGLVAVLTWLLTRKDDHTSSEGFFLAGRSLTFPLIAGSLLLTNLSTEQMVGLNGSAFIDGLAVMVWEVVAVIALVLMAIFFLPRFLRLGVTTVPEYLRERFDNRTELIGNIVFLIAYAAILLPIILYTGAAGMSGILDLTTLTGIESHNAILWIVVWAVGIIGSIYALSGGLRTVAVSDLLNGIGLLAGGLLVAYLALAALGEGNGALAGWRHLRESLPHKFESRGGPDTAVPFSTVFTGIFLINVFYWCTNQQIIQRTFGARSLAEGQKGVLLTGFLKLLGPLYLVLPGIVAFHLFADEGIKADLAYGRLVNHVLPPYLNGFFAAVMLGAILSSFNSALNSTCTLFSLGIYKPFMRPGASEREIVASGRWFGVIITIVSMTVAPFLAQTDSIFSYLQKMNGIYFIPILAVVFMGMINRRTPAVGAQWALLLGFVSIAIGYFVPPFNGWVREMHEFHFLGLIFVVLMGIQMFFAKTRPLPEPWAPRAPAPVDMTPWRGAGFVAAILIILVVAIYVYFG